MASRFRVVHLFAPAARPSRTDAETAGPGSGPATPSPSLFSLPAGTVKLVAIKSLASHAHDPIPPALIARLSGRVGGAAR